MDTMSRITLERRQVWIYLAAIAVGLLIGSLWPGVGGTFEALLWPVLVVLLYATFLQVPLNHVGAAFKDIRFLSAVLVGNFIVIPALVWALVQFLPDDPALRLGILLVLLVPCTDWFITFTQLAKGDASRAIAVTPINLLLQLLLLPVYLWLMADTDLTVVLGLPEIWPALLVVLVPLAVAAVTEWAFRGRPRGEVFRERLAWWPVPLLAVVVFLITAAQVGAVRDALHILPIVVLAALVFLILAAALAKLTAVALRLPARQGRTLAFSFGTRNSFVVLPLALSLPAGWEIAAIVIVIQSLVELLGMVAYLWLVPRWLFRDQSGAVPPGSALGDIGGPAA